MPCANYCSARSGSQQSSCGKHLNPWYDFDDSAFGFTFNCQEENQQYCQCTADSKCKFRQSYMEGSSYNGFMVEDKLYFGEEAPDEDGIEFVFGCVSKETKLFFTQDADGILGLGKVQHHGVEGQKTIYEHMHEQGIIESRTFSLCLGITGGYFQIGGFTTDKTIGAPVSLPVQT